MAEDREEVDPARVYVELDGQGVSPQTVDTVAFLRLASALFELIAANAKAASRTLRLEGIEIVDKCAALVSRPDDVVVATQAAKASLRQVRQGRAPHGLVGHVMRVSDALAELPAGHLARVIIGPWRSEVTPYASAPTLPLDAIVVVRATVMRSGGVEPRARFASRLEDEFSLEVTEEQARKLGSMLYREADIEAEVARDVEGRIEGGTLIDIHELQSGDPGHSWREWFRSVGGSEWDRIDDLDAELRH